MSTINTQAQRPLFFLTRRRPPRPTLFPYTTLFRSAGSRAGHAPCRGAGRELERRALATQHDGLPGRWRQRPPLRTASRSEEHTSELQSRLHLVCRLLLDKKNLLHVMAEPSVLTDAH